MGRPPSDDPRNTYIHFRVTESEAAEIDRRRGSKSRSEWLRGLISRTKG